MKKIVSILTTLILIMVWNIPLNVFAQDTGEIKTIAILDLSAKSGVDKDTTLMMTEILRDMVMNSGQYKLLARDKMEVIIKEQNFSQSDRCNNTECQLKLGEILAVQYLIAGTVGKLGQTYIISIQMIDVEKAQVVKSKVERTTSENDFDQALDRLAKYFIGTTPSVEEKKIGAIEVISSPDNAEIIINGQIMGKTPITIKDLQEGTYSLALKKQGYKDVSKNITIIADKTIKESINFEKILLTGSLEIKSEPDGATVVINGQEKGTTPLTLKDINTGTYRITLKKDGYKENKKDTEVKFNKTTTENITLEKIAEGGGAGWVLWVVLGAVVIGGAGAAVALSSGPKPVSVGGSNSVEVGW